MTTRKKPVLGRNLSSMLSQTALKQVQKETADSLKKLPLESIRPGRYQPRSVFDQAFEEGDEVVGVTAPRHHRENRKAVVSEGHRTVLEVCRRVGVGDDIGELLELERPLEDRGVVEAATEHHALREVAIALRGARDGLFEPEGGLGERGEPCEPLFLPGVFR